MSQRVGRLVVGGYHTPAWRPYALATLIATFTLLAVGTILFDSTGGQFVESHTGAPNLAVR